MVMSLLLNEGDSVLVERFTYSHMVENVINFRGCAVGRCKVPFYQSG